MIARFFKQMSAFLFVFAISTVCYAQNEVSLNKANSSQAGARVAVYLYIDKFGKLESTPNEIGFKSVDVEIAKELSGLFTPKGKKTAFDGRNIGVIPSAYVYFDDGKGIKKFAIVLNWEYALVNGKWEKLYALSQKASGFLHKALDVRMTTIPSTP